MTTDPLEGELDGMLEEVLKEQTAASGETRSSPQSTDSYLAKLGAFTRGSEIHGAAQTERAREYMNELAANLELDTQTVSMGEQIFQQFADEADLTGRVIEFVAAASLYCACKVNEIPINPETFATAVDDPVNLNYLLRRSKMVASTVGLDPSAFFDATHYVPGYCAELGASDAVEERAIEIIEACKHTRVESGKSPTGLAAAAIYNAGLELGANIRQSEIASVADVTEVTIRNRYQDQRDHLQKTESAPADPVACVWWLRSRIEAPEGVFFAAADLLYVVYDNGIEFKKGPDAVDWALGAFRVVGRYQAETPGLRTLSQFATNGSDPVKRRSKQISSWKHKRTPVYYELRKNDNRLYDLTERNLTADKFESTRDQVRTALVTEFPNLDEDDMLTDDSLVETKLSSEEIRNAFPAIAVARASLRYHQRFGNSADSA